MHRFTAPADPTDLPDFVNKAEWDAAQREGKSIAKVFKNYSGIVGSERTSSSDFRTNATAESYGVEDWRVGNYFWASVDPSKRVYNLNT